MPIKKEPTSDEKIPDFVKTEFKTTPKISTYTVAFVVSDFMKLTNEHGNFSVYARRKVYKDGQLALEVGEQLLRKLDDYTGLSFNEHFAKMDQFALPALLPQSVENGGLITHR